MLFLSFLLRILGARGAPGAVGGALAVADGVVAVDASAAVGVQAGQHVGHVVRKEALVVEHGGEHLRDGGRTHRLVVLLLVHLQARAQQPRQRQRVAPATRGAQHRARRQLEQLLLLARVDREARAEPRVGADHRVVLAGDGHDAAAVVRVRLEAVLLGAGHRILGEVTVDI
ncbi:hypothetical protein MSG28_008385 [Choristoneura fumiferana]|uniref:Uncharacterized protein n=1 Tax=Choristoneura fumiferana TaxID=7141 RepID=A0ACC0J4V9_CHOFU|nr:hypothetical protein MSG28_008385 [Choristoneura fumiferana]